MLWESLRRKTLLSTDLWQLNSRPCPKWEDLSDDFKAEKSKKAVCKVQSMSVKITCNFCPFKANNNVEFFNHIRETHSDELYDDSEVPTRPIPVEKECQEAKQKPKDVPSLNNNLPSDLTAENRITCLLCPFVAYNVVNLCLHVKERHRSNNPCKLCGLSVRSLKSSLRHLFAVHFQIKAYECSSCGKRFKNASSKHLKLHPGHPKMINYLTPMAGHTSFAPETARKKKDIELEEAHLCQFCAKKTNSILEMCNHVQAEHCHSNECGLCGKTFAKKRILLVRHIFPIHFKFRLYHCSGCNLTFKSPKHAGQCVKGAKIAHLFSPLKSKKHAENDQELSKKLKKTLRIFLVDFRQQKGSAFDSVVDPILSDFQEKLRSTLRNYEGQHQKVEDFESAVLPLVDQLHEKLKKTLESCLVEVQQQQEESDFESIVFPIIHEYLGSAKCTKRRTRNSLMRRSYPDE